MNRRASLLLLGMLCFVASLTATAASHPVITGTINGIELCPQEWCGEARFIGQFTGTVNKKATTGVFEVAVNHNPLPTAENPTAAITGGSWIIRTETKIFAGSITGGTLTYNGDNTYGVNLTMQITQGGSGTLTFSGVLNHQTLIPTIYGTISQ